MSGSCRRSIRATFFIGAKRLRMARPYQAARNFSAQVTER